MERLVTVLDAESQVVFVNCRSWGLDADGRVDGYADSGLVDIDPDKWANDFNADGREECRNYFVYLNAVFNASSVLFRKAIYERVSGADERLRLCGDWKLWAAMALKGRVAHAKEALNYYRVHGANVTATSHHGGLAVAEYMKVIHWILGRAGATEDTKRALRAKLSYSWIPAMVQGHVPFRRRCAILRDAIAIDPHALQRLSSPMFAAIRIKISHTLRFRATKGNAS